MPYLTTFENEDIWYDDPDDIFTDPEIRHALDQFKGEKSNQTRNFTQSLIDLAQAQQNQQDIERRRQAWLMANPEMQGYSDSLRSRAEQAFYNGMNGV